MDFESLLDTYGTYFVLASLAVVIVGTVGMICGVAGTWLTVLQYAVLVANPILLGVGVRLKLWLHWDLQRDLGKPFASWGAHLQALFQVKQFLYALLGLFGLWVESVVLGFVAAGVLVFLPLVGAVLVVIAILLAAVVTSVVYLITQLVTVYLFNYLLRPHLPPRTTRISYRGQRQHARSYY